MVSSFASCEKTDVLPGKMWVESHVVDVGAYSTVPSCFGKIDEITIMFVDML